MQETLELIYNGLTFNERRLFYSKTIMITGFKGFIGTVLSNFLIRYFDKLNLKRLLLLDNRVTKDSNDDHVYKIGFNLINGDYSLIPFITEVDYIFNLASIASPTFYRKFPLETMDANVIGLRRLLDFFTDDNKVKFLHFSTSEIYGNPHENFIPTDENYNGNVSTIGPRSCYDESKRYSETICYYYNQLFAMDISIVRPFNNYGPGLNLLDKRAPADFANNVIQNINIQIYSDGTPTRSYLYISDAIIGYIKAIQFDGFEIFNIGNDTEEITITEFASIFVKVGKKELGYSSGVTYDKSTDKEYLLHNPTRRMPKINKAREKLGFSPKVKLEEGISYYLRWAKGEESI
jgi:UDP-glucuronate decarboxylase